jgi:hypothetical protein
MLHTNSSIRCNRPFFGRSNKVDSVSRYPNKNHHHHQPQQQQQQQPQQQIKFNSYYWGVDRTAPNTKLGNMPIKTYAQKQTKPNTQTKQCDTNQLTNKSELK